MAKKLVGTRDAAEQLDMSHGAVLSWILKKQIEFVKVGRCVKIKQETIDNIVNGTITLDTKKPSAGVKVAKKVKVA